MPTPDAPYTRHDFRDAEKLPEQMLRLMVNRGMEPTIGLRMLALDLANLAATGEGRFAGDLDPQPVW